VVKKFVRRGGDNMEAGMDEIIWWLDQMGGDGDEG